MRPSQPQRSRAPSYTKPPLRMMCDRGQTTGRFEGTYILKARRGGNVLLRGIHTPAGYLGHVWISSQNTGQLPVPMPKGTRVSFIADLEPDPEAGRINLVDCREVRIL